MFFAIIILLLLPLLNISNIRSSWFRPIYKPFFWLLVIDCLLLGWIGGKTVEAPYVQIGQAATFFYFFYFIVLLPVLAKVENYIYSDYK
jgi:quinol-cytochrome oxidoreductase complex cytochrome b subunit